MPMRLKFWRETTSQNILICFVLFFCKKEQIFAYIVGDVVAIQ